MTDVERILRESPGVEDVRIVGETAFVVPSAAVLERQAGMQESVWKAVFEQTFAPEAEIHAGVWGSSYTGQPIPMAEIERWIDGTVGRVLALAPRRVLEIGCGDGQIMMRVLPHCESYLGLDFSAAAVANVERRLEAEPEHGKKGSVLCRSATELHDLPSFDTIILNSVAQYFPTADMFVRVVRRATELLVPGGALFVGDLRDRDLARAFYTSVERAKGGEDIEARVEAREAGERELLISPSFGWHLLAEIPAITSIHALVKPGTDENELVRFRYDMTVRVGAAIDPEPPKVAFDGELAVGLVIGIPNGRLEGSRMTLATIEAFAKAASHVVEVGPGEDGTWTALITKERRVLRAFGLPEPKAPFSRCTTHPALSQIAPRFAKKLARELPSSVRVEIVPTLEESG